MYTVAEKHDHCLEFWETLTYQEYQPDQSGPLLLGVCWWVPEGKSKLSLEHDNSAHYFW